MYIHYLSNLHTFSNPILFTLVQTTSIFHLEFSNHFSNGTLPPSITFHEEVQILFLNKKSDLVSADCVPMVVSLAQSLNRIHESSHSGHLFHSLPSSLIILCLTIYAPTISSYLLHFRECVVLSLTSNLARDCPSVWNIFFLWHSIIRDIKCQNIPASGNLCWHPKSCLGKSFCVSSVFYLSLYHSLYHCIELIAIYLSDSHSRSMCLTTKKICLMNA